MKKTLLLIIIHCFIISSIIAQDEPPLSYIRGGVGMHFLGSEDIAIPKLEFEYIAVVNKRLNVGISSNIGYGKHIDDYFRLWGKGERILNTFTIHIDQNIYLRMISVGNLHLYTGLGPSLMFVNDIKQNLLPNGNFANSQDPRFSVGGNIVFQLNYDINEKTALALRMQTQSYINGEFSTGMSLNFIKTLNRETND